MLQILLDNPAIFLVVLAAMIFALSFHEFAHAFAAFKLGDSTAERMGRLTLNPLAHIDWIGLLVLISVGFGWAKPVPFNPYNLKYQKWGPVLVSIAGPLSNLLLATLSAIIYQVLAIGGGLSATNALMIFLFYSVLINLALMLFNFLPVPPLDGSRLLMVALSAPKHAQLRHAIETKASYVFLAVILADIFLNLGLFTWLFNLVMALTCGVFLGGHC